MFEEKIRNFSILQYDDSIISLFYLIKHEKTQLCIKVLTWPLIQCGIVFVQILR